MIYFVRTATLSFLNDISNFRNYYSSILIQPIPVEFFVEKFVIRIIVKNLWTHLAIIFQIFFQFANRCQNQSQIWWRWLKRTRSKLRMSLNMDDYIIFRDGKGFFILHGTIDQGLVSLLLHSPPQLIFLGHILYRISPISILGRNPLASLYMGLIY